MMHTNNQNTDLGRARAALFDLDGVLVDTESQYTEFWDSLGREFVPDVPDFANRVKGETLRHIFEMYFAEDAARRKAVSDALERFENAMSYPLMPGAMELVTALNEAGWHTAVVTSSDHKKMAHFYSANPGFAEHFNRIFTAEDTPRSKPAPDPYLRAAAHFGVAPERCVVFEDSLNGVRSGEAAGMAVVGLSTTLPAAAIAPHCRRVVPGLSALTLADVEALSAV